VRIVFNSCFCTNAEIWLGCLFYVCELLRQNVFMAGEEVN
jgi:hypothetical protein